ncbi:hypothetical protein E1301_Tti014489 [Triplophysa tibetana]|uniref:Uncharacterized protein n=1 Tax=Triplophysa tibetana TaxID=1572043 RepID=A0A5A9PKC0_9TELE|nr:hypothetical protein E1301_Tti014489 [Triplophysa tibetana]
MLSESPRRRVASRCRGVRAARTKGVRQWLSEAVALGKRKCTVRPPSKPRWNGDLCCHAPGSRWGGCLPSGSEGVAAVRQRPKPASVTRVGGAGGGSAECGHRLPEAGACIRPPKGEEQGTGNTPR